MKPKYLLSCILGCVFSFVASAATTILPNNPNIQYVGRFDKTNATSIKISWTGTQIIARFQGTSLKLIMDSGADTYYNVTIDGNETVLPLKLGKVTYTLASGLADTIHSVALFKRDSPWNPQTFIGLVLDDNRKLVAPPLRNTRKIEFYGDSQAQGAQNEVPGFGPDLGPMEYDNNSKAYGAIVARHFNAEYSCIASCGISLTPYPEVREDLPSYFDRTGKATGYSLCNFASWQANVVCVALGANDNPFPGDFSSRYVTFAQKLREKYPNAFIFLLAGPLPVDDLQKSSIADAVKTLQSKGDQKVFYRSFKSVVTYPGHPRVSTHQDCAQELIDLIKPLIWNDDTDVPSAPGEISLTDLSSTGLTLKWKPSTDRNSGVYYEIFKNGVALGTTVDTTMNIKWLSPATQYDLSVRAINVNGNSSDFSDTLKVTTAITYIEPSVNEEDKFQINICPNPFTDHFSLALSSRVADDYTISVRDLSGAMVFEKQYRRTVREDIEFQGFNTKSTYILTVANSRNQFISRKIIQQ